MKPFIGGALILAVLVQFTFTVTAVTRGANLDGSKSDPSTGQTWGDGNDHVVLIKVNKAFCDMNKIKGHRLMVYSAKVLFDMDGSLTGKEITASGVLDTGRSNWDAADLKVGDVSALHIQVLQKTELFECAPSMMLSIGLQTNIVLHPEDVKSVEAAMRAAAENLPVNLNGSWRNAEIFLKDDNYFLWALGVTIISQEHSKEGIQRLQLLAGDKLSKPELLWLVESIGRTLPESDEARRVQNDIYFRYLSKDVTYPAIFAPF